MLSKGQIVFAIVFFVVFVIGIAWAYRKDKADNKAFFKNSYRVLLFSLFVFFALYGIVKIKHLFMH